jgi:hypothetical protein
MNADQWKLTGKSQFSFELLSIRNTPGLKIISEQQINQATPYSSSFFALFKITPLSDIVSRCAVSN